LGGEQDLVFLGIEDIDGQHWVFLRMKDEPRGKKSRTRRTNEDGKSFEEQHTIHHLPHHQLCPWLIQERTLPVVPSSPEAPSSSRVFTRSSFVIEDTLRSPILASTAAQVPTKEKSNNRHRWFNRLLFERSFFSFSILAKTSLMKCHISHCRSFRDDISSYLASINSTENLWSFFPWLQKKCSN
jgi:hypothetical protein